MKFSNLFAAFQILFYPGSHVPVSKYQPLLDSLPYRTEYAKYGFLRQNKIEQNETILVAHSFGGYFALLDALRCPDKISGIVLLNSHFNSRWKAVYPPIRQGQIQCPVLTILSEKDDRLPLRIAIDDFYEKTREGYRDKYYLVNKGFGHFSGMTGRRDKETEILSSQIRDFFSNNFSCPGQLEYTLEVTEAIPRSILLSRSAGVVDALLKITLPRRLWEYYHWLWFLAQQPDEGLNTIYETEDYLFLKTINVSRDVFTDIFPKKKKRFTTLPSIHTAVFPWLGMPLKSKRDEVEILEFPIRGNKTYYRCPHPIKTILDDL